MRYRLCPHPSAPSTFAAVEVEIRRDADAIQFTYRVTPSATLLVPAALSPARADGLWRTTCFEAFIRPGAGDAYLEFNFSPSSAWAAYRFDGYRSGMTNADVSAPAVAVARDGKIFSLTARVDVASLRLTPSARVGVSAVLEDMSGAKTYWALAHSGDKPDFHRADAFIARLPFESRA